MNNGMVLQRQLNNLGISAIYKRVVKGIRLINYYYDLKNALDIRKIKSKNTIDIINAYNKTELEITIRNESDSCFYITYKSDMKQPLTYSMIPNKQGSSVNHLLSHIGMDNNGNTITIDFGETPHLLIAGATGTGKSVLLNTLIASLYHTTYRENFNIYCIDTKRTEFNKYKGLSNATIITESDKAIEILKGACDLMEERYKILEKEHNATFNGIFIVIDELADLMLLSDSQVENYIVRLAQKSRASNIHLILATQRPMVKVISGLIKANITTRIGLKMASVRDSVMLFDKKCCEKLLGKGDALINDTRFQVAMVSDDEWNKINNLYGGK